MQDEANARRCLSQAFLWWAAGVAVFQTLSPGAHILLPDDVYHGFRAAARDFLPKWGIHADFVAMDEISKLKGRHAPRDQARVDRNTIQPSHEDCRSAGCYRSQSQ